MNKVRMKDIAALAGVSTATVSYVLNNVGNQTIPDTTRRHILQLAEELNYVPNLAARSLSKRKTGLAGILLVMEENAPFWRRHSTYPFISRLEGLLTRAGYHTLLYTLEPGRPKLDIIVERKLEAVFLVNVPEESFHAISRHFVEGVPLIVVDSLIDDKLFKQVVYDYPSAVSALMSGGDSGTCLIMERFGSSRLTRWVQDHVPVPPGAVYAVDSAEELDRVLQERAYPRAVVINEFLASAVLGSRAFSELSAVCTSGCPGLLGPDVRKAEFAADKAEAAFRLMQNLLDPDGSAVPQEEILFIR